jgi:hypothetical protein
MKKTLAGLCLLVSTLGSTPTYATNSTENPGLNFERLIEHLKNPSFKALESTLKTHQISYSILIHSPLMAEKIKGTYTSENLRELKTFLKPVTSIKVSEQGFVQAADREIDNSEDPTHYDAIWLRDSLWIYLGLYPNKETRPLALKILTRMLDYVSSPDQLQRFSSVIANPSIINSADGAMKVVHIRFDGKSPLFHDVQIKGISQQWNHKQNDALGLLFDLVLRSIENGDIAPSELTPLRLKALAYFPAYFSKVKFFEMEDAGSWEEIERSNSSSISLVTSSLEKLESLLKTDSLFKKKLRATAKELKVDSFLLPKNLSALTNKGYERIFGQLKAGGESPLYPAHDPRFRKADAALLNLIFPAQLTRLTLKDKENILKMVEPLIGQVGIKRYLNDSYQCGNFWFKASETQGAVAEHELKTDDTSSAKDFEERAKQFVIDSEAQWFFDSWYSKILGLMYQETKDSKYLSEQIKFFNRSLAQITGGSPEKKSLGADGRAVMAFAIPESYNTVFMGKERYFAASPITPLNWAKATLLLALDQMEH